MNQNLSRRFRCRHSCIFYVVFAHKRPNLLLTIVVLNEVGPQIIKCILVMPRLEPPSNGVAVRQLTTAPRELEKFTPVQVSPPNSYRYGPDKIVRLMRNTNQPNDITLVVA